MIKAGIFALLFFLFLSLPTVTFAVSTPHCTDPKPQSAPVIVHTETSNGTVTLVWVEAADPVTHYMMKYGNQKDVFIYGSTDIGPKGTHSYTVNSLTNGVRYYFRIAGVNNCRPGSFSHTVSVVVGEKEKVTKPKNSEIMKLPNLTLHKKVLGASTSAEKNKTKPVIVATASTECAHCKGIPFLLQESLLLMIFFYLIQKRQILHPFFAAVIPFSYYAVFRYLQQDCHTNTFFCNYFLQLSLGIFVLSLLIHKFFFYHKRLTTPVFPNIHIS